MPPVVAGIGAAAGALSGAFVGAGGFAAGAIGLSATGAAAGAFTAAFQQIALGAGLSALGQAFAPKPGAIGGGRPAGMRLKPDAGETGPQSFIVGRCATAGELVFHGSYKTSEKKVPNNVYVQVFELSDIPLGQMRRAWINGEWAELGAVEFQDRGFPVKGYRFNGQDRLWLKYYDGTQTVADPQLVANFGPPYAQPWLPSAVGYGIPYVVITAGFNLRVNPERPKVLIEVEGLPLYDPRKDSSIGGSGAQRLGSPSTWRYSANPKVIEYNILLGIRDPITGKHMWGGQGIRQSDLPASEWMAAMNACDNREFEVGLEIRVSEEPAEVCDELNRSCLGRTCEVAGVWHTRAGAPSVPVYFFTDADVVISSPDTFTPFPQLDASYNGARATYPDPGRGWQTRDAPPLDNADFLAEDKGLVNTASLQYRAVFKRQQVQKLKYAALKDSRRWRRHSLVLPPDTRALTPLDSLGWTSSRNGYPSGKAFEAVLVEDLENGCTAFGLREWDPDDYDYDVIDLPDEDGFTIRPPIDEADTDFWVEPGVVLDNNGVARAPAIDLFWDKNADNVDAVRYRVRLASSHVHLPTASQGSAPELEAISTALRLNGQPLRLNAQPLTYTVFSDEGAGQLKITEGIKNAIGYEVQAVYSPTHGRRWSPWMPVTTLDVRLKDIDFDDLVNDKVNDAKQDAQDAKQDVLDMLNRVEEVEETVSGLGNETLDRAEAILDALADLDGGAIADLTGISVAGLRRGAWVADPTFREWTAAVPSKWSGSGLTGFSSKLIGVAPDVPYLTGIKFVVPTGSGLASLFAASNVAGQMVKYDLKAKYVLLGVEMRANSGGIVGGRLRVEWQQVGSSTWERGHAFGAVNSLGRMVEDYGIDVDPDQFQSHEVIWEKPFAAEAGAVRVFAAVKQATPTTAVEMEFHYLSLSKPTDAEVKGYLANGVAVAEVDELRIEITGPEGAIAGLIETVRAEYGPSVAKVTEGKFALTTDHEALAAYALNLEASFGDLDMVRNGIFRDGVRADGDDPNFWTFWPSGFGVIARNAGSGSARIADAPTPFLAEVDSSGLQWEARAFDDLAVVPGEKLMPAIAVAVGGSGAHATVEARLEFRSDPAGAVIGSAAVRSVTVPSVGAGWVRPEWSRVVAPAGAAFARMIVRRNAGAVGTTYFTQVSCRKGDPISLAEINVVATTKVTEEQALAAMRTELAAEFGMSYSATITSLQTAVATADYAASAYVIRATAGAGSAGFRLVAFDDEDGSGGAFLVDAPYLIQKGTIAAGELVVMDLGYNMVLDSDLQSPTYWTNPAEFQIIKDPADAPAALNSKGLMRYIGPTIPLGGTAAFSTSDPFTVRPGMVLTVQGQIGRSGGTFHEAGVNIRFQNRDGTEVIHAVMFRDSSGSGAFVDFEERITVPDGMRIAQYRWIVVRTNGQVRFGAPSVQRRSKGSSLITPDGAFFGMLTAEEAWIKEGNFRVNTVGTLILKGGANGRMLDVTRNSNFSVTPQGTWVNICTVSMPSNLLPDPKDGHAATAKAICAPSSFFTTPPDGGQRTVAFRLRIDGVTVWEEPYDFGNSGDQRNVPVVITKSVNNGDDIQWQMRKVSGSGSVDHTKTYMSVTVLFQVA